MSKMKMKLVSLLFITLLFSPHTVMAEFDPTLKAALATVIGQRDMTMNLVFDSHARARQIERDAFPGRLPQQVPEYGFCQNAASGRFDDMKVTYNRIIESIRNGTATESTIRTNTHDSVTINNALIDAARKCLLRNSLIDLNQTTIEEAWMKIFTSYKSMNEKERKKLSKHLEKKVRWKTTR